VWGAIRAYLAAAGRLAGIGPGDYVFAPLAAAVKAGENNTAQDWARERCLSHDQILASLKLYGRLVKIPERKLTMRALRRTAIRLRLDQGAPLEELRTFLDSRENPGSTRYRLGKLPQLPETNPGAEIVAQVPDRKSKIFRPGDGIIHGYYADSQPQEQVLAVLAEDIQGIEAEIAGLRRLARGLVAKLKEARSNKEIGQLADTHSLAASRLGELIDAEKQLAVVGVEDTWAEEALARLDKGLIDMGESPVSEALRAGALEVEPELAMAARSLEEEIAAVRYMLRNVLGLALQTQETPVYIRLVEIYGSGCARLVRMLKKEGSDQGRLERYLREAFDEAIREVNREWAM
jgi:DNA-binding transcriptional MerR regulator